MSNMNGFELAGRPMKVNHVTERDASLLVGAGGGAMEMLDGEDTDVGVGMTPQSRASLMAKLAEGHNAGGWALNGIEKPTECLSDFVSVGFCIGGLSSSECGIYQLTPLLFSPPVFPFPSLPHLSSCTPLPSLPLPPPPLQG